MYYTLDMYGYISFMGNYDSGQTFLNSPIKCYCVKTIDSEGIMKLTFFLNLNRDF